MKNSFSLNRLLSRFFHRFRYFWLRGYERDYPPGLVFSFFFVSAVSVFCVLFGSFSFMFQYLFLMYLNIQNGLRAFVCKSKAIALCCVGIFFFRFCFLNRNRASPSFAVFDPSKVPRRHSVALVGYRAAALYRMSAKSACA